MPLPLVIAVAVATVVIPNGLAAAAFLRRARRLDTSEASCDSHGLLVAGPVDDTDELEALWRLPASRERAI